MAFKFLSAAAIASLLMFAIGCAPISPDSMRADPARCASFTVPDDFLAVYQNEVHALLRCMTGSYDKMTFAVKPRINAVERSASIVYAHHSLLIQDTWAIIDIKDNGSGSTVHAYAASDLLMRDFPSMAEKWAHGSEECPQYSPVLDHFPIQE